MGRALDAGVNMFRHHTQLSEGHSVSLCDFAQNFFTKVFILLLPKHLVPVLCAPFEMMYINADFVRIVFYFEGCHFCSSPTSKAHANLESWCVAQNFRSPRIFLFYK